MLIKGAPDVIPVVDPNALYTGRLQKCIHEIANSEIIKSCVIALKLY